MALFKSGNPTLSEKIFDKSKSIGIEDAGTMTVRGTMGKFGLVLLLTMASAGYAWKMVASGVDVETYMWVAVFAALGVGILLRFQLQWGRYLVPVYGLLQGFAVGTLSAYYNYAFAKVAPNIVVEA